MVCFGYGGLFRDLYFRFFIVFERTRPAASIRPSCLINLLTINSNGGVPIAWAEALNSIHQGEEGFMSHLYAFNVPGK